jgi:hypothetical protein
VLSTDRTDVRLLSSWRKSFDEITTCSRYLINTSEIMTVFVKSNSNMKFIEKRYFHKSVATFNGRNAIFPVCVYDAMTNRFSARSFKTIEPEEHVLIIGVCNSESHGIDRKLNQLFNQVRLGEIGGLLIHLVNQSWLKEMYRPTKHSESHEYRDFKTFSSKRNVTSRII